MRFIYVFFFFLSATSVYSSLDERECSALLSQQRCLHSEEQRPVMEVLLGEWGAELRDRKYKLHKPYLFWVDNNEENYWLRTFLATLKSDLSILGIQFSDRMANRKGKPRDYKDTEPLANAERILLLVTRDLSLSPGGDNYLLCSREWRTIDRRLSETAGEYGTLARFKPGSILPLVASGYPYGIIGIIDESKGSVLNSENLKSFSYLDLIVRLSRFAYEMPADCDFHMAALTEIFAARPEFKKATLKK